MTARILVPGMPFPLIVGDLELGHVLAAAEANGVEVEVERLPDDVEAPEAGDLRSRVQKALASASGNRDTMTTDHGSSTRDREQKGTRMDKLEVVRHLSPEGEEVFDWRIRSGNHVDVLANSAGQGYTERGDALEGAHSALGQTRMDELIAAGIVDVDETPQDEVVD